MTEAQALFVARRALRQIEHTVASTKTLRQIAADALKATEHVSRGPEDADQ